MNYGTKLGSCFHQGGMFLYSVTRYRTIICVNDSMSNPTRKESKGGDVTQCGQFDAKLLKKEANKSRLFS
jgi:hypothetical protein